MDLDINFNSRVSWIIAKWILRDFAFFHRIQKLFPWKGPLIRQGNFSILPLDSKLPNLYWIYQRCILISKSLYLQFEGLIKEITPIYFFHNFILLYIFRWISSKCTIMFSILFSHFDNYHILVSLPLLGWYPYPRSHSFMWCAHPRTPPATLYS